MIYFAYIIRFYLLFFAQHQQHHISKLLWKKTHGSSYGWASSITKWKSIYNHGTRFVGACVSLLVCYHNILNEIACSNLNCSAPPPLTVEPHSLLGYIPRIIFSANFPPPALLLQNISNASDKHLMTQKVNFPRKRLVN